MNWIDPTGELLQIPIWAIRTVGIGVVGTSLLEWWYWNVDNPEPFDPPGGKSAPDDSKDLCKQSDSSGAESDRPREQPTFPTSSGDPGLARPIAPDTRQRPRQGRPRPSFPPRAR